MNMHWASYWLGVFTPTILILAAFLIAALLDALGGLFDNLMREPAMTPTGVPIIDCPTCGLQHPITREHCSKCGRASAFIGLSGRCLGCQEETVEVLR